MFVHGLVGLGFINVLKLGLNFPSTCHSRSLIRSQRLDAASTTTGYDALDQSCDVHAQLIHWLQDTFPTSAYVNPVVKIQDSLLVKGAKGAFAAHGSIAKGELIFCIPRDACLTETNVLNDPDCGADFKALIEKAGPGGFTVAFAGYLAKEYLLSRDDQHWKKQQSPSQYRSYLSSLPWGAKNQDHILFWSDQQIEGLLAGSLCYEEATGLRKEVFLARKVLTSILQPIILRESATTTNNNPFSFLFSPQQRSNSHRIQEIGDAITAAFVILLTRSFEEDFVSQAASTVLSERPERLIPILDMLNHDSIASITYSTHNETGTVEVRASRDITQGEELFNCYRQVDVSNMPYHRFFTRFGFVPGFTTHEDIILALRNKDPIFFPPAI